MVIMIMKYWLKKDRSVPKNKYMYILKHNEYLGTGFVL